MIPKGVLDIPWDIGFPIPMGYPRPPWKSMPTQISHGGIGIPMDPVNLCYLGFPYPHWNSNGSLMDIDFFYYYLVGGWGERDFEAGARIGWELCMGVRLG